MVNATLYSMNFSETPIGLVQAINSGTFGAFGVMSLSAVWLFIFISLRGDSVKGFFAASFVTLIMGVLFRVIGIAPDWVLALLAVATFGSFVFVIYQANRTEGQ